MMYYLINMMIKVLNKGFRFIDGYMKSYKQIKKGLSFAYIPQENCV
jgi:hypothetical protein